MAAAMVPGSPLYRTFQVYKFSNRKYNFLLNYFGVLNVWHGFVFCKNTDKHTVKNWDGYAPVFCETVFGTVLVPGTGVQP